MSSDELNKMDLCRHLLPEPGGEVVGELISELRKVQVKLDAANKRIAELEAANKEIYWILRNGGYASNDYAEWMEQHEQKSTGAANT